jgi:hypothetical protein
MMRYIMISEVNDHPAARPRPSSFLYDGHTSTLSVQHGPAPSPRFLCRAAPTGAAGYDIGMDIGYHIISMMSRYASQTADAPL